MSLFEDMAKQWEYSQIATERAKVVVSATLNELKARRESQLRATWLRNVVAKLGLTPEEACIAYDRIKPYRK